MSRNSCSIVDTTRNQWQEYKVSGAIDSKNTSAITFVNMGTCTAIVNGFPMAQGVVISFGNDKCSVDCTNYQLAFMGAGTKSFFVFKGELSIQLSSLLNAASGVHSNVNIFDSAGATLTASAGKLTVLDATLIAAVNAFAGANHTDLGIIATDIINFAAVNHTDLGIIATDIINFAAANHTDLGTIATDITNFAAANHADLTATSTWGGQTFDIVNWLGFISGGYRLGDLNAALSTINTSIQQLCALISAGGLNVNIISPAPVVSGMGGVPSVPVVVET